MQRRIKFTHTGHSHLLGNFQAGDTFSGDEAACRHFVEDAGCAEWADVQAPAPQDPPLPAPAPEPEPEPEPMPAAAPTPDPVQPAA